MFKIIGNLFFAFVLAIIVHLVLFMVLEHSIKTNLLQVPHSNQKVKGSQRGYSNIKYVKIQQKEPLKEQVEKLTQNKPVINNEVKKIIQPKKQKKIQTKKKSITKTSKVVEKDLPKPEKPVIKNQNQDLKSLFTLDTAQIKHNQLQAQNKQQKLQDKSQQQEKREIQKLDPMTQSYIKLYGEQYFMFSAEQKKYLKNNLSKIGIITQRFLEYPYISARTGQSGTNVIEFDLYPNGDIQNLKLLDKTGYTALDENTVETIKIAYKDYPRPYEITKIRIFVKYVLY
ncbi:MAG: energy transducer TonB [Campylobacterales bacterium]|nr:energy transducer TonB [Campylobacterales bacterium]